MRALVGCTGFVGGNIAAKGGFDGLYHSTDIEKAFGTKPELLVYAGLRAEKFIAEKFPEEDLAGVRNAMENIRRIAPERLVLISSIEVYENTVQKTENSPADGAGAYGKNRALFEQLARESFPDCLIVRLPGLFGKGIKKNFIYDYIHYIPKLLKGEKLEELSLRAPELKEIYSMNEKGFYQCRELSGEEQERYRKIFEDLGFSALNFTDSRGIFQYYNLAHLYDDIFRALDNNIRTLNIAAEPVSISEIYGTLTGREFVNEISGDPPRYDFRSVWYEAWNGRKAPEGEGGYLYGKEQILKEIKMFTEEEKQL